MIVAIKGDLEAWKLFRDGRDNKWCRPPFMPGRLERDGKGRWHGFSCEKCFMASPMAIWQQEQASPQAEWCPQRAYGCTSPTVQNSLSCNVSDHLTKKWRVIFHTLVIVGWIAVDDCSVCTFCKKHICPMFTFFMSLLSFMLTQMYELKDWRHFSVRVVLAIQLHGIDTIQTFFCFLFLD